MSSSISPADLFLGALERGSSNDDFLLIPEWGKPDWSKLFSYMHPVRVEEGDVLIQRGIAERSLYFVVSGTLEASAAINASSLGPIFTVKPGSLVGEVAFFDGNPRSTKVWAIRDSDLMRLDFEDYERFLKGHPVQAAALLFALGRLIALRLRRLTH